MIYALLLIPGLFARAPSGAQTARPSPPFVLTISSPTSTYTAGEEVEINVLLHDVQANGVEIETTLVPSQGFTFFKLAAARADGQAAPASAYSKLVSNAPSLSDGRITVWGCSAGCGGREIPQGGTFAKAIMVTSFFDLTAPGKYTIQVSAQYIHLPLVKSNAIEITVVPPREP